MDRRVQNMFAAFLKIIKAADDEIQRLNETNRFNNPAACLQLTEDIRSACMHLLNTLSTVERRIQAAELLPPPEEGKPEQN